MKATGKKEPPRRQGLLEGSPARRQGHRGLLLVVPTLLAVLAVLALGAGLALVVRADSASGQPAPMPALVARPPADEGAGGALAPLGPLVPDATRDLWISKYLYNKDKTGPGNLIVYRIYFRNYGNSTASDVRITDTLPVTLTYVSDWNNEGFTTVLTGNTVLWTRPNVDASRSGYLYLAARITDTATPGEVLTNVVEISSSDVDAEPGDNSDAEGDAVDTLSRDLSVGKNLYYYGGDPIPGQEFIYNVYFANQGTAPVSDVVLTDTLPTGVTFVSWSGELDNPYPVEIDLDEILTVTVLGNQLVWHLGTLEGGATGFVRPQVRVVETVAPGEVLTNVARISTTDVETATALKSNVVTHTTTILSPTVDLEIDKDLPWWEPDPFPGNEIVYGIDFENTGVLTATNVVITDTLPVSLTVVSWSGRLYGPDYVYLNDKVTPVISGSQIIWAIGSLVGGAAGEIDLTVRVSDTASAGEVLTNLVEISTDAAESSYANNGDAEVNTVAGPIRDLAIYKEFGTEGAPGGEVEYRIGFDNRGSTVSASDVVITDALPVSMTFVSWSGELRNPNVIDLDDILSPTVSHSQVVWHLGDMATGDSGTIYLRVRISDTVSVGAVLENTVVISSSDPDTNTSNNADTQSTSVISATEDLYVRKTLDSDPPAPGGMVEYAIYFSNEGSLTTDVTLTDTLPAGSSLVSWRGTLYNRASSIDLDEEMGAMVDGNQVVWHIGPLIGGGHGTIYLTVRVAETATAGDLLTNAAAVSQGATETNLADNDAVHRTLVAAPTRDLNVQKWLVTGKEEGAPTGSAYYSIQFGNNGNSRADDVVLTDTLPAGATLIDWSGRTYGDGGIDLERTVQPQVMDGTIMWPLGYLDAEEGGGILLQLDIPESVGTGDVLTNVVEITTSDDETTYANNVYTRTDQVIGPTWDLEISKGASEGGGAPGGHMRYYVEFWNNGNADASNVIITDTLPDGTSLVSWEGDLYGWSFDEPIGAIPTPTVTVNQVVWHVGTLPPFVFGDLGLTVAITDSAQVGDPLENKIEISTSDAEVDLTNNTDVRTDQVMTYTRDVSVYKSPFGAVGTPGGTMWYAIGFDNDGNWRAADVFITETLLSNLDFVSWYGELYNPDYIDLDQLISPTMLGNQLIWHLPEPLVGKGDGILYVQVRITDTASVGALIKNKVEISTSDVETDYGNNKRIRSDHVTTRTWDLDPHKSLHAGTPVPGDQIEFKVEYQNRGNWEASNVVISDTLPDGLTYVSSRDESGPLTPTIVGGNTAVWSIGSLPAGGSGYLTITVELDSNLVPGAVLYNRIDISSDQADTTPKDNVDIERVTVLEADFSVYLPLVLRNP